MAIEFTSAEGFTYIPSPQIPIIAIQCEVNSYTLYTSLQQMHTEGNFDKKSHTFLLLHELMYHGSNTVMIEFVDYTFLKASIKRYLLEHRPSSWQRLFPVSWSPQVMHPFIDWLTELDCAIQIDISYRETIDAAHRDAFYPPNPRPYIPEFIQALPSTVSGYDTNVGYNVNSTYGKAPFRKKWEK